MSPRERASDCESQRAKWDQRYRSCEQYPEPAAVLVENLHLLPPNGRALDLACGLGAGALLLAQRGFEAVAWDLSAVAIERLSREAKTRGLEILGQVRDVCELPPEPGTFDLILVSHFLDRDLSPALTDALRPRGLLFYQTFSREAVSVRGPSHPAFRLESNELLRLFPSLIVRFYREEGWLGDTGLGTRDLGQLVAQKPG